MTFRYGPNKSRIMDDGQKAFYQHKGSKSSKISTSRLLTERDLDKSFHHDVPLDSLSANDDEMDSDPWLLDLFYKRQEEDAPNAILKIILDSGEHWHSHAQSYTLRLEKLLEQVKAKLFTLMQNNHLDLISSAAQIKSYEDGLDKVIMAAMTSMHHIIKTKRDIILEGNILLKRNIGKTNHITVRERLKEMIAWREKIEEMKLSTANGYYTTAIQLYDECIRCFPKAFKDSRIMQPLYDKYKDHITKIKDSLETSLMQQCIDFDPVKYEFTVLGFYKLNMIYKLTEFPDLFIRFIHDETYSCLHQYVCRHVLSDSSESENPSSQFMRSIESISRHLSDKQYIEGLRIIFRTLSKLIYSFAKVMDWHHQYGADFNSDHLRDAQLVKEIQSIENGLFAKKILFYNEIQETLCDYIANAEWSRFSFYILKELYITINEIEKLAYHLLTAPSDLLRGCYSRCSQEYIQNFHTRKLENLSIMLNSEEWISNGLESSPFLSSAIKRIADETESMSHLDFETCDYRNMTLEDLIGRMSSLHLSQRLEWVDFGEGGVDDDLFSSVSHEYGGDMAKENGASIYHHTNSFDSSDLQVTNITVCLFQWIFEYYCNILLFKDKSELIFLNLCDLIQFYVLVVVHFFSRDLPYKVFFSQELPDRSHSEPDLLVEVSKFSRCASNFELSLLSRITYFLSTVVDQKLEGVPFLNPFVKLNNPLMLFGLSHRCMAIQSFVIIFDYLSQLRPYFQESKMSFWSVHLNSGKSILDEFYGDFVQGVLQPLPEFMLRMTLYKILHIEKISKLIYKENWSKKEREIGTDHHSYVDKIFQDLIQFKNRLSTLIKSNKHSPDSIDVERNPTSAFVPDAFVLLLWNAISERLMKSFLDGLLSVKKFNDIGIAKMLIDFKELCNFILSNSPLLTIPNAEKVEAFIQKHYLEKTGIDKKSYPQMIVSSSIHLARLLKSVKNEKPECSKTEQ